MKSQTQQWECRVVYYYSYITLWVRRMIRTTGTRYERVANEKEITPITRPFL